MKGRVQVIQERDEYSVQEREYSGVYRDERDQGEVEDEVRMIE